MTKLHIRSFAPQDIESVVKLWQVCDLLKPWNNPYLDIERKGKIMPELFLIGEIDDDVVASAMAGYDGHRGWVYYLAVHPSHQNKHYGQQIMKFVENRLIELGCPKLNLLVRTSNLSAIEFYKKLDYTEDACVTLGKRLIPDT